MKRSCAWQVITWFEKKEQRKIAYSMGGNETEIDFVLVSKNNRKYLKDVKAILWGIATSAGGNRHRQNKVVKNEQTIRRRVWIKPLEGSTIRRRVWIKPLEGSTIRRRVRIKPLEGSHGGNYE